MTNAILFYFQFAYIIYKSTGSTELAAVTSNLGDFYVQTGNDELAIRYLLESNKICTDQELKTQLITNYKLLATVYINQGRTADAYEAVSQALALNEEVYTLEKTEKIAQLQLAYETEKKDRIIAEEKATSAMQAGVIARQRFVGSLLAGGALIIIGGILFYMRQRQLKRKLEYEKKLADDRLRISADLHDEIGSALSSIGLYSEVLKNTLQASDYPAAINYGSEIANTSRELMDNMSDLVWAVNPRNDSFEQLTTRLSNFGYKIFGAGNTNFKVEITGDISSKEVPMAVRHQIYMILKEALNNSAKYAQAKNVLLSIKYKPDSINLSVTDDGRGFDIANAGNGNGLQNMRRRAENIDAQFDICSGNTGTQLTFNIPIP
ncbi:MAG TPA: histidine kinase [Chitinophagales bacterium]|nr:histidine kinase [Chitinophagales bacterium]